MDQLLNFQVLCVGSKQQGGVKRRPIFECSKGFIVSQGAGQGGTIELIAGNFPPVSLSKGLGLSSRFSQIRLDTRILWSGVQFAEIPLNSFCFQSRCVHGWFLVDRMQRYCLTPLCSCKEELCPLDCIRFWRTADC